MQWASYKRCFLSLGNIYDYVDKQRMIKFRLSQSSVELQRKPAEKSAGFCFSADSQLFSRAPEICGPERPKNQERLEK